MNYVKFFLFLLLLVFNYKLVFSEEHIDKFIIPNTHNGQIGSFGGAACDVSLKNFEKSLSYIEGYLDGTHTTYFIHRKKIEGGTLIGSDYRINTIYNLVIDMCKKILHYHFFI